MQNTDTCANGYPQYSPRLISNRYLLLIPLALIAGYTLTTAYWGLLLLAIGLGLGLAQRIQRLGQVGTQPITGGRRVGVHDGGSFSLRPKATRTSIGVNRYHDGGSFESAYSSR